MEKLDGLSNGDRAGSNGLAFIGVSPGCGKTTVMTGLTSVLSDYGANVRAIKPLGIGAHQKDSPELSFISIITKSRVDYPLFNLKFPPTLSETEWKEILLTGTKSSIFTFIELPGGCATPINFERDQNNSLTHDWQTSADLVKALGVDCVLVGNHSIDILEKIDLSMSYLLGMDIQVRAIVTVETNSNEGGQLDQRMDSSDFELMLTSKYRVPYLGKLGYSPVISVQKVTQGNLKKSCENDLDLLALRRLVELPVT